MSVMAGSDVALEAGTGQLRATGYTPAQVAAQLVAPARSWRFRYRLLNRDGLVLGAPDVSDCTVTYADLADVKRTADFTIRGGQDINFATERIQPLIQLRMPDGGWHEWPMGVFLMASPKQRKALYRTPAPREVTAYDLGLVLRDDKLLDRYTVQKGNRYLDGVIETLGSAQLPTTAISGNDKVVPAAMEWPPGTTKAQVINDLLGAINYRPLQFDGNGVPRVVPYQSPADAPPVWNYDLSAASVVLPGIDETLDLSSVANAWVLVVSQPDRAELRSTYVNDSTTSPTSTVNVQRRIVDYREEQDAADQATLNAKTRRLAEEASQVYAKVEWDTGMMPIHGAGDVLILDSGDGPNRYRETEWSMKLAAGEVMHHAARRVVTV